MNNFFVIIYYLPWHLKFPFIKFYYMYYFRYKKLVNNILTHDLFSYIDPGYFRPSTRYTIWNIYFKHYLLRYYNDIDVLPKILKYLTESDLKHLIDKYDELLIIKYKNIPIRYDLLIDHYNELKELHWYNKKNVYELYYPIINNLTKRFMNTSKKYRRSNTQLCNIMVQLNPTLLHTYVPNVTDEILANYIKIKDIPLSLKKSFKLNEHIISTYIDYRYGTRYYDPYVITKSMYFRYSLVNNSLIKKRVHIPIFAFQIGKNKLRNNFLFMKN